MAGFADMTDQEFEAQRRRSAARKPQRLRTIKPPKIGAAQTEVPPDFTEMDHPTFLNMLRQAGVALRKQLTPPEVLMGMARPEAEPLGVSPEAPTPTETLADIGRQATAGVVRGAGNMLAFPLVAAEMLPGSPERTLPQRELGMTPSQALQAGTEALARRIEGEQLSPGGRPAGKIAEEATAGGLVAGPVFSLARRGVRSTAPILGKWFRSAAAEPGQFWAEEAASAAGAGLARAGAPEGGRAEVVAGLGGGMAPAAARTVAHGVNILRRTARTVLAGQPSEAVKRLRAAEIAQLNVTDRERALRELSDIEELRERIAVNPGMFGSTADPGLRALEIDLLLSPNGNDPVTSLMLETARQEGNKAVREAFIHAGPPPASSVETARSAVSMNVQRRISAIDDELARGGAYRDLAELSQARHAEILESARLWRQEMRRGFGRLERDAEAMRLMFPPSPLKRQATLIRKAAKEYDILPEDLLQMVDDMPALMRFGDLESFRRRIQREIVTELSRLGGVSESRAGESLKWLYMLRDGVQQSLDQAVIPSQGAVNKSQRKALELIRRHNPNVDRKALDEFSDRYARQHAAFKAGAETYRDGITSSLTDRRLKRNQVLNSNTLSLYARSNADNAAEAADEFLRKFPQRSMQSAMNDHIVGDAFNSVADENGIPVASRLARWMRNHSILLKRFPEARARLDNVQNLTVSAEKLGIRSPRSKEAVQRGALALFVDDPHEAMKLVLRSENPALAMRNLMREIGTDPAAMNGLRRVFWDLMEEEVLRYEPNYFGTFAELADEAGRPRIVGGPYLRPWIDRNEAAMRQLFGKNMIRDLRYVAGAADIQARTPSVMPPKIREEGRSAAAEVERSGTLALIASPGRRVLRAITRGENMLDRIEGKYADRILREAMVDSRLLRMLLERNTKIARRALRRYVATNLPTLPFRTLDDEADEARTD